MKFRYFHVCFFHLRNSRIHILPHFTVRIKLKIIYKIVKILIINILEIGPILACDMIRN